ncbi:uncharacterized protein [Sagmatias obliquidens]|uniref:uncharacterized protein n=1 Tax=Sagmatias obliquidens TaxID=3371155 RepID=UPI000F443034|nr:uncharacterized protein LOC113612981 [Lagenorhynchus obliquidens]
MCVCVQEVGKAVLTAVGSVALRAQVCGVYTFLQGFSWSAQLAGSWVALHVWLSCALVETLRRVPLMLPCEQVSRWLVWAAVQAGRGPVQVWGTVSPVQLGAHTLFLGAYLRLHVCFAAISSKVRVRVHSPFCVSLPFRVHGPLSPGFKVRLRAQRLDRAEGEVGVPQGEQRPQVSRRLEPARRWEVLLSRGELCPGGRVKGLLSVPWTCAQLGCQATLGACSSYYDAGERTFSPLALSSLCGRLSPFPAGLWGPPSWTTWSLGKAQAEGPGRAQALPSVR